MTSGKINIKIKKHCVYSCFNAGYDGFINMGSENKVCYNSCSTYGRMGVI